MSFNGEPWFRGNDVARILGFARSAKAIFDHVPQKFISKSYESLLGSNGVPKTGTPTMDYNTRDGMFINEVGLYRLVFRSYMQKKPSVFTVRVCPDDLPAIRTSVSYTPNQNIAVD